jgi:stress-induced morphogen
MEFSNVVSLIQATLHDAKVKVEDMTGTKDHLNIVIISDHFKGKMLRAQHQMVMDILKESLKSEIHAVQLKTMDFETAEKRGVSL